MKYQKPFLKWVGGKTQIIDEIVDKFPSEIKDYHELFLGGGSVLFALLTLQKEKKIKITGKIYAYDFNPNLINLYKIVQSQKDKLFEGDKEILKDVLSKGLKNGPKRAKNYERYLIAIGEG